MHRFSRLQRLLPSTTTAIALAAGGVLSVLVIASLVPWQLTFGNGADFQIGCAVTLLATFLLARASRKAVNPKLFPWLLSVAAIWTFCIPMLLEQAVRLLAVTELSGISGEFEIAVQACLGLFCILPGWLCGALVFCGEHDVRERKLTACGLGGGLLLLPLILMAGLSLNGLLWLATVAAVGLGIYQLVYPVSSTNPLPASLPVVDAEPSSGTTDWTAVALAALCGGGIAVGMFLGSQLVVRNAVTDLAVLGAFALGIACAGRPMASRVAADRRQSQITLCLLTSAWLTLLTAAYPFWSEYTIRLTAWISNVNLLTILRSGILIAFVLPAGWMVGRLYKVSAAPGSSTFTFSAINMAVAAGFAGALYSGLSVWSISLMLIALSLGLAIWNWSRLGFRQAPGRTQRLVRSGLIGTGLAGLLLAGNVNSFAPDLLHFSTRTFMALRQGLSTNQIAVMDDGRRLITFEDLSSRWSIWRHRGVQLLARRNGIAQELRSTDPSRCPHSGPDLVPALLPLALHSRAEHVLILGMHTPTLQACQSWPLHTVTTIDADAGAHQYLQWALENECGLTLHGGAEFLLHQSSPALAVRSAHPQPYDIILCPQLQPAFGSSASLMTQEFYLQASRLLSEGGLFCQRLPYYDLGPDVIRTITGTLRSVFPQVMMVEMVSGELLLVATHETHPLVDTGCVERMKSPQCRELLAAAGWDWSTILSRGGLTTDGIDAILAGSTTRANCRNGGLAFRMPAEVGRWDAKMQQTRDLLAPQGQVLGSLLGESPEVREMSDRLEDLKLASQIQVENPDEPWAYRTALKKRLKERPRSEIVQVKHEGLTRVAHPEDQRRKDYLVALGKAATRERPLLDDVQDLARFGAPFDPLVSIFVHYEIAELYQRAEESDPTAQLEHRLHTVYYASAEDHSVRTLCSTISLICNSPETIPDSQQRWDHLNGLLEMLELRWQLRINDTKSTRYEPVDTEKSIAAIEQALRVMGELAASDRTLAANWNARQESVEQSLLRPLREHRSRQIRRYTVAPQ